MILSLSKGETTVLEAAPAAAPPAIKMAKSAVVLFREAEEGTHQGKRSLAVEE
jgi:hypothetical protein